MRLAVTIPKATTSKELTYFDLPEEALRFVFDLNILGTMLLCQVMAEQGRGVVLNISSMNADRPLTRIPAYSVAKAGVSNFTRWLAVHLAQAYSPHIRVNALAPVAAGAPKTIDDDVGDADFKLIDHTPGYGSAARYWAFANENAGSSPADPILVIQAMGHKIGSFRR